MKAKLLSSTADAELLCGTAALTSTKSVSPSKTFGKIDLETIKRVTNRVDGYGHASVMKPPESKVEETKKQFRSL